VVPGFPYIIVYVINQQAGVLDVVAVCHGAQHRQYALAPGWRRPRKA
jgi:hypothetical protein